MELRGKLKLYNTLIVSIVIIFTIFTAVFNYIIDPFDVFRVVVKQGFNENKPCLTKQERMTKIPHLKAVKETIDIVYVGSSKTDWWLDTKFHSELTGKNVYSAALSSSSLEESIIMAKNCIFLHPEIKTVYFGLDFFSFSKKFAQGSTDLKLADKRTLTKEETLPLILSFDTLNYSIKTVLNNLKKKKSSSTTKSLINPKAFHYFEQSVKKYDRDYYSDYILNEKAYEEVLDFQKFAKSHNVNVVFFVTPTHVYDLVNIYEHGIWDKYKEFKLQLAKNLDYYDLSSISKYNTEKIAIDMKYFRDSVHASNVTGELFAQNFYQKPNDTAKFITKQNITNYLNKEDIKMNNFMKNNPDIVKQVKEWIK